MDTNSNGGPPPGPAITQLQTIINENLKLIGSLASKTMMKQEDKETVKTLAKGIAEKVDQLAKCVDTVSISTLTKLLDQKLSSRSSQPTSNSLQTVSYAAAVKVPAQTIIDRKVEESTVIIKATSPAQTNKVQNLVYNEVKTMRSKKMKQIKINAIIRTKTGAVVKVPKEEDFDELIARFKANDELNASSSVYKSKDLQPTGVLKGISKLTDYTELPSILSKMNPSLSGQENGIKVIRVMGQKNDSHDTNDVAVRVDAKVYQILRKMDRIFTDYNSVTFKDKIFVRQCQNCFHFNPNHTRKDCNKAKHCTCGQSGDHDCSKTLKCINCSNHPKHKGSDNKHRPNCIDCPLYKQQQDIIIQKTSYGNDKSSTASQPFTDPYGR